MKKCNSCGSEHEESVKFCTSCGVNLDEQNSTEEVVNSEVVEVMPTEENPYSYAPYSTETMSENDNNKDALCTAALVLGIIGFFLNPIYICSILAIIFGAIGLKSTGEKANCAKIGLILGIASLVLQFFLDLIITLVTGGAGIMSFCC